MQKASLEQRFNKMRFHYEIENYAGLLLRTLRRRLLHLPSPYEDMRRKTRKIKLKPWRPMEV
jgi:hypothetical protein